MKKIILILSVLSASVQAMEPEKKSKNMDYEEFGREFKHEVPNLFCADLNTQNTYSKEDQKEMEIIIEYAPEKIRPIIQRLSNPQKYNNNQLRALLLIGAPGTGKSLLARAIAWKIKSKCLFISAPSLMGRYRNTALENLKKIFNSINKNEKTTVVLDEINYLLQNFSSEHTDTGDTASFLWTYIDTKEKDDNFLLIGTANDVSGIPEQLQSRFRGNRIEVTAPVAEVLSEIFELCCAQQYKNVRLDQKVDKEFIIELLKRIEKFTARDVKALVNEALNCSIMGSKKGKEEIGNEEDTDTIIFTVEVLEKALNNLLQENKKYDNPNAHLGAEDRRHKEALEQAKKFHEEDLDLNKKNHKETMEKQDEGQKLTQTLHDVAMEQGKKTLEQTKNLHTETMSRQKEQFEDQKKFQREENDRNHLINAGIPLVVVASQMLPTIAVPTTTTGGCFAIPMMTTIGPVGWGLALGTVGLVWLVKKATDNDTK